MPHIQKLWEKTKDRSDLLVVTMNVDEELGLVEPFMKEKGYTFPVLPAYSFIHELLDSVGVPQNWIVDRQGKWQWQMLGFNAMEVDWEGETLAKLEVVQGTAR